MRKNKLFIILLVAIAGYLFFFWFNYIGHSDLVKESQTENKTVLSFKSQRPRLRGILISFQKNLSVKESLGHEIGIKAFFEKEQILDEAVKVSLVNSNNFFELKFNPTLIDVRNKEILIEINWPAGLVEDKSVSFGSGDYMKVLYTDSCFTIIRESLGNLWDRDRGFAFWYFTLMPISLVLLVISVFTGWRKN